MKKILLGLIIILALFLRLYKLGEVPPGVNWDEAALGYTGYSILKTGNDEWGIKLPLFTKQFGEYKSAIYPYFTAVSIYFFDLNEFSVRLPSAISGAIAILAFYFLVKNIFELTDLKKQKENLALISSLIMAINPWHLHFSRYALSANLALTFVLISLALLFSFIKNSKTKNLLFSIIFATLAVYTYHSFRIVLPLIFIFIVFTNWKIFIKNKKRLFLIMLLILFLAIPLFISFKKGYLTSRADKVSLFNSNDFNQRYERLLKRNVERRIKGISFFNNKNILLTEQLVRNILSHFSSDFLFLGKDANLRYGTGWVGKFYYLEAFLLLMGLISLSKKQKHLLIFLLFWLLSATIPAALSNESPHPIRSYFLMPGLIIIISLGILYLLEIGNKNKFSRLLIKSFILIVYFINFSFYLNYYYIHFSKEAERDWQAQYKPVVNYLTNLNLESYQEILFSNEYGQPHIFLFFYGKIDPWLVQKLLLSNQSNPIINSAVDKYKNFRFTPIIWDEYINKENSLIIDTRHHQNKLTDNQVSVELLEPFYFKDQAPAFFIYETKIIETKK